MTNASGFFVPSAYRHTQSTAASTWTIAHNLGGNNGFAPVVDVYINNSGTYSKIIPLETTIVDNNNLTVTFTNAETGFAVVVQ
jgi:hypothetical protein